MNKLDYYEIGKRIRKCREEPPETDIILWQSLSEAKKYGSQQYQKYTRLLQALVGIVDRL